jgi:hypothetical protein
MFRLCLGAHCDDSGFVRPIHEQLLGAGVLPRSFSSRSHVTCRCTASGKGAAKHPHARCGSYMIEILRNKTMQLPLLCHHWITMLFLVWGLAAVSDLEGSPLCTRLVFLMTLYVSTEQCSSRCCCIASGVTGSQGHYSAQPYFTWSHGLLYQSGS